MLIRLARQDDLVKILEIYNQTIASRQVTADLEAVTLIERQAWFDLHQDPRHPLMVVEEDQVEAWFSLSPFLERRAYQRTAEISIYVDEFSRRKGVAKEIMSYIDTHMETWQLETLVAKVFGHNEPSLCLFKKFGYEVWGQLPKIAELDGIPRDLIILGKRYRSR